MNYTLQRNICRTCLTEGSFVRSIFNFEQKMGQEIQLCDMLMALSSLVIVHGDGLPENICLNCSQQLTAAYSFKKLCEASDTTLRDRFRDSNEIILLSSIKEEVSEFDESIESDPLRQENEYKNRDGIENTATEINKSEDKAPNFLHDIGINDTIVEPTVNNFSAATFHKAVGETYSTLSQLERSKHKETIDENGESMDKKPLFLGNNLDVGDIFIDKSDDKASSFSHNVGIDDRIVEPMITNFPLATFHKPMEGICSNTSSQVEDNRHEETVDEYGESMDAKPILVDNDLNVGGNLIDKSEDKTPNFIHNNLGMLYTIVEPKNNFSLATFHNPMEESCSNTLRQLEESNHKETVDENDESMDKRYIPWGNVIDSSDSVKDNSDRKIDLDETEAKEVLRSNPNSWEHKESLPNNTNKSNASTKIIRVSFTDSRKKASNSLGNLEQHKGTQGEKKAFLCTICGKRFTTKSYLKIHSLGHTGLKPYKCEKCGKGYLTLGPLANHLRSHCADCKVADKNKSLATHINQKFKALKFSQAKK